jgi:hypothetical protein
MDMMSHKNMIASSWKLPLAQIFTSTIFLKALVSSFHLYLSIPRYSIGFLFFLLVLILSRELPKELSSALETSYIEPIPREDPKPCPC